MQVKTLIGGEQAVREKTIQLYWS